MEVSSECKKMLKALALMLVLLTTHFIQYQIGFYVGKFNGLTQCERVIEVAYKSERSMNRLLKTLGVKHGEKTGYSGI